MIIRHLATTALLTILVALPAQAEVYRQVDANGNVTFTDEPADGAERIQVKPVTTITLPKPEAVKQQLSRGEEGFEQSAAYESVSFVKPTNDEAFHSGSGNVQFQVASQPKLKRGHQFEITLDGQPVAQTTSGSATVNNVFRGTHKAGVNIVNQDGERIYTGEPIRFTIHRPSTQN